MSRALSALLGSTGEAFSGVGSSLGLLMDTGGHQGNNNNSSNIISRRRCGCRVAWAQG
jgi:hypothetical protein